MISYPTRGDHDCSDIFFFYIFLLTVTTQASPGTGHTSFFNHSEGGIMASLKQQMCQQVVDKYKRHRIYIDDFNMSPTTLILFL